MNFSTVASPALLGSLVPPSLPWSVVHLPTLQDYTPPATPRLFIPLALLDSSLPSAPPWSSVALAPM